METLIDAVPEFLKYGPPGLSALLFLFAYLLLRDQALRDKPNPVMLKSIKFFQVCCISLVALALLYAYLQPEQHPAEYKVVGFVKKQDESFQRDIRIDLHIPPYRPNSDGEIVGLSVHRDKAGELPIIYFTHPDYETEQLDLNNEEKVTIEDREVRINEPVTLIKTPTL